MTLGDQQAETRGRTGHGGAASVTLLSLRGNCDSTVTVVTSITRTGWRGGAHSSSVAAPHDDRQRPCLGACGRASAGAGAHGRCWRPPWADGLAPQPRASPAGGLRPGRVLTGAPLSAPAQVHQRPEADPSAHAGLELLRDSENQEENCSEPTGSEVLARLHRVRSPTAATRRPRHVGRYGAWGTRGDAAGQVVGRRPRGP